MKLTYLKPLFLLLAWYAFNSQAQNPSSGATTIILVRHAEQDKTIEKDPPLNADGIQRTELLKDVLSKTKIAAAYATTYTRGKATAEPVAKANGIEISYYKLEDDEAALIKSIQEKYVGKTVLIIGHSGNIAELLNAASKSTTYNDKAIDGFSDFYVVDLVGDKPAVVTRLKYGK